MIGRRVIAGILVAIFFATMLALACGPLLLLMLLALSSAALYDEGTFIKSPPSRMPPYCFSHSREYAKTK